MLQKKKKFPYLDRDISWMFFNRRILQEACRPHVPLLERMSFLGIYSNNLDEFFRVRMASQSRIAECADKSAASESEHAKKLIKQISRLNSRYVGVWRSCGRHYRRVAQRKYLPAFRYRNISRTEGIHIFFL